MPHDLVISKFIENKINGFALLSLQKDEIEEMISR
jgi:hypothetical protein